MHLAHMRATFVSTGKSFLCSVSSMRQAVLLRPKPPAVFEQAVFSRGKGI